ncbi:MAG: pyridoxal kinase [Rickettsiales bacterium]|nr:pyridoxal kinase [Rickettsiales bacterium]|tara:strand:+ start:1034 stop:1873 length:840 start_codon:yes stop_codon:yes gene_type:complete
MSVLMIQSRVASGYVGNSAAVPCLQQYGLDCLSVDTVHLSNHPAHGSHRGRQVPPKEVAELIRGISERGILSEVQAIQSGYLGSLEMGPVLLDAVGAVKKVAPSAPYCLDPVMGDNGTLYVEDGLVDFFRTMALPAADIALPNIFEAACLLGRPITGLEDAITAASDLQNFGPKCVILTGIETPAGVTNIGAQGTSIWQIETPKLDVTTSGAGDVFTAVFLGCLVGRGVSFETALETACNFVFVLLMKTKELGKPDIALIESLQHISTTNSIYHVTSIH